MGRGSRRERAHEAGGCLYARSVMVLTAAPDLPFVIGLPAGLLILVCVLGAVTYTLIGRIKRG
jgi:hypothetical protein